MGLGEEGAKDWFTLVKVGCCTMEDDGERLTEISEVTP